MAQHIDIFGGQLGAREIDHERSQAHGIFSNTAMDSTCVVCGNMSNTPAPDSLNPWATNTAVSRAKLPGWQEIYTTRRGSHCGIRSMIASAPARGGSSSTRS